MICIETSSIIAIGVGVSLSALTVVLLFIFRYEITGRSRKE